jgi:hypothetical protein
MYPLRAYNLKLASLGLASEADEDKNKNATPRTVTLFPSLHTGQGKNEHRFSFTCLRNSFLLSAFFSPLPAVLTCILAFSAMFLACDGGEVRNQEPNLHTCDVTSLSRI